MSISNIPFVKETLSSLKTIQPHDLLIKCFLIVSSYIILSNILYVVFTFLRDNISKTNHFYSKAKRVLIVIAHPDDECMFFGPLIVNLVQQQKTVCVLCLSNGDAENIGYLRKQELYDSCRTLGVLADNITLTRNSLRQDGHQYQWSVNNIADLILDYVEKLSIDTVVTFDSGGVSGHPNHVSLFWAVCLLNRHQRLSMNCRVFLLDSITILRKYSCATDCFLSLVTSNNVLFLSLREHGIVKQAMRKHKSQYVWFRKIYIYLSRYTIVNTFHELIPCNC